MELNLNLQVRMGLQEFCKFIENRGVQLIPEMTVIKMRMQT